MSDPVKIAELLAPARDAAVARQALLHGADAVYMGGPSHGARAAAANSLHDLEATARLAHLYGARLYVTLNTLVYPDEIQAVERMIRDIHATGADALIIQDMGILEMNIPEGLELHASTQCDIRTPEKAVQLAQAGLSRLVLPREMSLEEMSAVREALPEDVEIEAFVHGALCVSYSGDCQASYVHTGRSANRGECAQLCRLPYDLTDSRGNIIIPKRHFLSLKDLNRSAHIAGMLASGVNSFKIEGRLKDEAYVKNAVTAYRRLLDEALRENPQLGFKRLSAGESRATFEPDLAKGFNRGYTTYFTTGAQEGSMASLLTPKSVGEKVAVVERVVTRRVVDVKLKSPLANGDGLSYIDNRGELRGVRLNRVDGNRLYAAADFIGIASGTVISRSRDTAFDRLLAGDTAVRTLALNLKLQFIDGRLTLTAVDQLAREASADVEYERQEARTPQRESRKNVLSKLGGTAWRLESLDDSLNDSDFVPASVITALRREVIKALESVSSAKEDGRICPSQQQCYLNGRPRPSSMATMPSCVNRHANVANPLARQWYEHQGIEVKEPAIEITVPKGPLRVMTTRYCLRRELGACLKKPDQASCLPRDLHLRAPGIDFALQFDCRQCCMHVIKLCFERS